MPLQSFFCGAEYLNSSAYLVENADSAKKGYVGSWVPFGAMSGVLVASIKDIQNHRTQELNSAIDRGLMQLARGKKISAKESYDKLKAKINTISQEHEEKE